MQNVQKDRTTIEREGLKSFRFKNSGRDMNLVNMILNIESNNSNNYTKPLDVYDVYMKMKELDLHPNFIHSLKNSKDCVMIPPLTNRHLSDLKTNDPHSFLALPVLGKGHLWSTLIRKTDEGFSAMIVNKGLRFWHDPVEEFVFEKKNQNKLIHALKYCGAFKMNSVEDVYRTFIKHSDARYNISIHTSPQKVGNCFTKNIQAAIKLAYATQNLKVDELKKLRIQNPYTPFGTSEKNRVTFKWEAMPTEQMQKVFVQKIVDKNPSIAPLVRQSISVYTANKHFRENVKKGGDAVLEFKKAFEPEALKNKELQPKAIMRGMKSVTPFTYGMHRKALDRIVDATGDKEYIQVYQQLARFTDITKNSMGNLYFHFYMEARHEVLKSLEAIFDKQGAMRDRSASDKAKALLPKLDSYILMLHGGKIKQCLREAYQKENVEEEFRHLFEKSRERMNELSKKMPTKEEREKFAQYFPIILGQVNHRISKYYNGVADAFLNQANQPQVALNIAEKASPFGENYENLCTKGIAYSMLGNPKQAILEFSKAIALDENQPSAYIKRGLAYEATKHPLAAKADFQKAQALDPELKDSLKKDRNGIHLP
jgi:tetratricopeptide (TPR) repeat protein